MYMKITCFIVQTTGFNKPAKFLILLKHWGYYNFELNWFHGLSKSRAIPFSQVSADLFRFNIQKCSQSLYSFIAFRPTCFAWRLVMRNLHETSTQLYLDSKNNSRRITYGIGCVWGMPSLSPVSSLDINKLPFDLESTFLYLIYFVFRIPWDLYE